MEKTADIYINIPVKSIAKPYTYLVPEQFDFLKAGCRVLVPFGGRLMEGFIIKIHNTPADFDTAKLKEIKDVRFLGEIKNHHIKSDRNNPSRL